MHTYIYIYIYIYIYHRTALHCVTLHWIVQTCVMYMTYNKLTADMLITDLNAKQALPRTRTPVLLIKNTTIVVVVIAIVVMGMVTSWQLLQ